MGMRNYMMIITAPLSPKALPGKIVLPVRKWLYIAILTVGVLFSNNIPCHAGCGLESVTLKSDLGKPVQVIIQTKGDADLTSEQHPEKLVLYLNNCTAPPGSHSIPGDGVVVKKIRWNYKPESNSIWVVVEHIPGAKNKVEKKNDGHIAVVFSSGQPTKPNEEQAKYIGTYDKVPAAIQKRMAQYSWNDQCPVSLDALSYLKITHWGFDGKPHQGELIVNRKVAPEVIDVFKELFDRKFPVNKMRLIEEYQGSDDASMADNNSSAFNCRLAKGSKTKYSTHSHGLAIDINPLVNPYVKNNRVSPKGGADFLDRTAKAKGMIVKGGPCYNAFTKRGWQWGGDWKSLKDYQHFEKP
jgi:hypothetical protein